MYRKDALPTSSIGTTVVTTTAGSYSYHMSSTRGQRLTGFSSQQQQLGVPRESTWYPPVVSYPEQLGGYAGPTPVKRVGTWHDNRYVPPAWSTTSAESAGLPYPPAAPGVRSASFEAPAPSYLSAALGAKPPGTGVGRNQFAGYQGTGNQSYGGWYEAERSYPPPPYPTQPPYPAERSTLPTTPYTQRSTLPTTTYGQWGASYGRVAVTHLTSSTITRPTESVSVAAIMPLSVNVEFGQPQTRAAADVVARASGMNQHLLCPVTEVQSGPGTVEGEASQAQQAPSEKVEVNVEVDVEAINSPPTRRSVSISSLPSIPSPSLVTPSPILNTSNTSSTSSGSGRRAERSPTVGVGPSTSGEAFHREWSCSSRATTWLNTMVNVSSVISGRPTNPAATRVMPDHSQTWMALRAASLRHVTMKYHNVDCKSFPEETTQVPLPISHSHDISGKLFGLSNLEVLQGHASLLRPVMEQVTNAWRSHIKAQLQREEETLIRRALLDLRVLRQREQAMAFHNLLYNHLWEELGAKFSRQKLRSDLLALSVGELEAQRLTEWTQFLVREQGSILVMSETGTECKNAGLREAKETRGERKRKLALANVATSKSES